MKVPVVVASLIALTVAGAIPLVPRDNGQYLEGVPGDNSGYVEGVSRYIWMPDGDGVPHLVDLMEPVDESTFNSRQGADNEYWLYTRENPYIHQLLVHGDIDSVRNSSYSASRPTNVVVHGWNNDGNSDVNTLVRNTFLESLDCNVIVLDWHRLSGHTYGIAVLGVPEVGEYLGDFLVWLFNNAGGDWNELHLVGHSLGAHVIGNAGRQTGGLPRRITACDPAGPLWLGNSHALDTDAGVFVEAIHTDGGVLGIYHHVGHVDFYPNGGTNPQPGCLLSTCSHSRSYQLFAASVRYNHLLGHQCDSMTQVLFDHCSGSTFELGNGIISKSGNGIFRLNTEEVWPF